jgi:hypothetical protein
MYFDDNMDLEPPPPGAHHHQQQRHFFAPAAPVAPPRIKLQPFWEASPDEWFGLAEAQFELAGIFSDRVRFINTLSALPEHIVRSINDLLRPPSPPDAYNQLRRRLLASHGLTEYQRLEKLTASQGLGGQKPSEMLAALTQLCPAGEAGTRLFRFLFLQRLPRELRILLSEDVDSPLHTLAARADVLWSHNSGSSGSLAAVAVSTGDSDGPSPILAAVQASDRGRGGNQRGRNSGPRGRGGASRGGTSAAAATPRDQAPVDFARAGTGLCHYHFCYGDKAKKCTPPCAWQGN